MSDTEADLGYPPEWLPPSRRPRPGQPQATEQPIESLKSGCPDPLQDEREEDNSYPPQWVRARG
jgi:hypothetical protein